MAEAQAVVDTIERWQARYEAALGRRLVYASDEYYLLAQRPFPPLCDYDDIAQHENGIGMARTFEAEVRAALVGDEVAPVGVRSGFFASVDGAPATGYRATRTSEKDTQQFGRTTPVCGVERANCWVITGELGAAVLEPMLELLPGEPKLLPVKNTFFGGNIGVTGLLTGADIAAELATRPETDRYLLPDVMLSRGRFLDGTTAAELPRTVEIVKTDGAALVKALQK
jgi:NifB/MoaA-like Fe-S oxidoreductase